MLLLAGANGLAADLTLSHGRFESISMHVPVTGPQQFVMLLADTGVRDSNELAEALKRNGALVAVLDVKALFTELERDEDACVSPDGDLENLSHYLQAQQRLTTYHTPILVGDGVGSSFVYAMLAQAPKETFTGGISLEFCPELMLRKPLCQGNRLTYTQHADGTLQLQPHQLDRVWTVLNSTSNRRCIDAARSFAQEATGAAPVAMATDSRLPHLMSAYAALARLATLPIAPPPTQVSDLPLIEVPTTRAGDSFAIMLSGDGGWAGLDKEVAAAIAASGMPVVGVDSLRYFWKERTPDGLAQDINRIGRAYTQRWQRKRIVLIGYSQGADVLPFAINRLSAATQAGVASAVLMGLSDRAMFEFHVGSWLGVDHEEGLPTEPEMHRIRTTQLICIYGEDDDDSTCARYAGSRVRVLKRSGGHHFDGDYKALADVIVRESK